jgi:protein SCO1
MTSGSTRRVFLVLPLLLAACTQPEPLAKYGEIPQFDLIAQTGQPFDSRSLDGHPWIANFVYTTCPGPCPMMSHQMHGIQ